jgi:mannose-6-phosphate isomerase-like protein (cupin superfamily)
MQVMSWTQDEMMFEEEYNVWGKRLFPWEGVPEPAWGGAWLAVDPEATSTPHGHDECEMFFIVQGQGVMDVDGDRRVVGPGDTIFIPPFSVHSLTNLGDERLLFTTVWWGGGSDDPVTADASTERPRRMATAARRTE